MLTVGSIMTFASLLFSPETKHLHLDEVGEKAKGMAGVVAEPAMAHTD